jgi:hypothetical protein
MLSRSDPSYGLASRVLAFPSSSICACGKVAVFDEWPSVHPQTETTVRIHDIRNTWPARNELQVPSSPGRESCREYTFLASLTAI